MLANDRDALACDLAETYGILDMNSLPVSQLATLASGLREDSRSRMRMSDTTLPPNTLLLAAAVDRLSLLLWSRTKDALHGHNRPASVLALLLGETTHKKSTGFATAAEYEAARQAILRG